MDWDREKCLRAKKKEKKKKKINVKSLFFLSHRSTCVFWNHVQTFVWIAVCTPITSSDGADAVWTTYF